MRPVPRTVAVGVVPIRVVPVRIVVRVRRVAVRVVPAVRLPGRSAVDAEESLRKQAESGTRDPEIAAKGDAVALRQRVWPLIEMMKRSHAAGEDIVWGV